MFLVADGLIGGDACLSLLVLGGMVKMSTILEAILCPQWLRGDNEHGAIHYGWWGREDWRTENQTDDYETWV